MESKFELQVSAEIFVGSLWCSIRVLETLSMVVRVEKREPFEPWTVPGTCL